MAETIKCPKCGSSTIWKYGLYMTKKGKKQKYNCKICGHIWGKKIKC